MKISAIGFDWGGVIFQTPGGSFNDAAAEFLYVDNESFRRAFFLHNHMVNKGINTKTYQEATEMWSSILSELGKASMLNDFLEFVRSRPKGIVNNDMINLVKMLRANGWKVGLFSNNSKEGAQEFHAQGYDQLFDVALFSAEVDCMKPESAAFNKLASALGVPVNELLFIDDSERSLSTADEVGFVPLQFKGMKKLVEQLSHLGISAH